MNKIKIELINTCPCCDRFGGLLKDIEKRFPEKIDLKIYTIGKDFEYLQKYGQIVRETMIINESEKFEDLSRELIAEALSAATGAEI